MATTTATSSSQPSVAGVTGEQTAKASTTWVASFLALVG